MDTKVPTPTDTEAPERAFKAPAALEPGDWVKGGELANVHGQLVAEPAEVLHVHSYPLGVALLFQPLGFEHPFQTVLTDDALEDQIPLATDAELAEVRGEIQREEIARELRSLARMVEQGGMPLPTRAVDVEFSLASADEVQRVAELLGVEMTVDKHGRHEATWPPKDKYGLASSRVTAEWYCYVREPKPELVGAREVDNGDPAATVPAGVDGAPVGGPAGRTGSTPVDGGCE